MSTDRQETISSLIALLFMVGTYSAVFWEPGIFLALTGFVVLLGMHLAVGIVEYRKTMSRPWPRVPPLEDDDEDW